MNHKTNSAGAKAYIAPKLVCFGSVRNLTGGSLSMGTDGSGLMTAMAMSDPQAKENIVQVGSDPRGFNFYLFDYKQELRDAHGHGRHFGVMADEIEQIMPEAVILRADGYRMVDYAKLGITLH